MECNVNYLRMIFILCFVPFIAESADLDSTKDNKNATISESKSQDSTSSESKPESNLESKPQDSTKTEQDKVIDYEFPEYKDIDLANSLISRFSLHNENYFLPIYYQSNILKPYKKYEVKFQFSVKMNIFRDLFYGVGAYFGYTQKSFFQMYSPKISSPFRDSDYMPEIMLYKPLNIPLFGGEIYNVRFGFKHNSNGEMSDERSRGVDMIMAEMMYKINDFKLTLEAWAYIRKDPPDIDKYLGYSNLILEYDFLTHNNIRLTISNLVQNYAKYKGNVLLEYKYNFSRFAIYVQYFYGYADNDLEYNIKKHGIGVGVAVAKF